jgi:hypothetical protein
MNSYAHLSEAIREGAKLSEQAFGDLVEGDKKCAIGAALEALGLLEKVSETGNVPGLLFQQYTYLGQTVACPRCRQQFDMGLACVHLNDDHRWTRESIADWLAQQEEKLGYRDAPPRKGSHQHREAQACRLPQRQVMFKDAGTVKTISRSTSRIAPRADGLPPGRRGSRPRLHSC